MHEPSLCLFFFVLFCNPRLQPKHRDPPAALPGLGIQHHATPESTGAVTPGWGRVPAYRLPLSGCPAVRGARGEVTVPLRGWPAGRVTLGLLGCLRGAVVALHGAALDTPAAGHGALQEGTEGEWSSHHSQHGEFRGFSLCSGLHGIDSDALSNFQVRLFIAQGNIGNLKPVRIFAVGLFQWGQDFLDRIFIEKSVFIAK